ncbi:hypothetical protein [Embleya sp. AB8]|uniref:hypothetical protein n=1 Tax=Embleya sp. AB8 TaxID=3156304 RepID=UPI003C750738
MNVRPPHATSVRILTDADVERAGPAELGRAAYTNLIRVPVEHDEVPIEGRALLHTVYGDSPFVASKALFLDELARQVTGESLPDTGALVVVPTRHLPAYHPIADGPWSTPSTTLPRTPSVPTRTGRARCPHGSTGGIAAA